MIVVSNNMINEKAEPCFALIGYKHRGTYKDLKYFPIIDNEIKAEISFSYQSINELKECVNTFENIKKDKIEFKNLIPKNIIFVNKKNIVWTVNPMKKYLIFKNQLKLESNYYFLPKLIFAYINNVLMVFAVKKKNAINENTELYNAPFLNVYENGNVCMGNIDVNVEQFNYYEDITKFLEIAFFKSEFTHTNYNNIISGNIIEYFKKQKNEIFNEKILLKSKVKSINNLLNLI